MNNLKKKAQNSGCGSGKTDSFVPPLSLPKEKDDCILTKPADVWDIKLNTPDTASTVSWGVSANRSVVRNIPQTPTNRDTKKNEEPSQEFSEYQSQKSQRRNDKSIDTSANAAWVAPNIASRAEFVQKHDTLYWNAKSRLFEAILVDQLSRSVLCDPAQDVSRASSRPYSSRIKCAVSEKGPMNLHQTLVNPTDKTVNEAVLDRRIQFDARVLCRDGSVALKELSGIYFQYDSSIVVYELRHFGKQRNTALPFIERSNYVNPAKLCANVETSKAIYSVFDITAGFDLVFMTQEQPCLPASIKNNRHCIVLRIVAVDESAKRDILKSVGDFDVSHVTQKQVHSVQRTLYDSLADVQRKCRFYLTNQNKPISMINGLNDFCCKGRGYFGKDFYTSLVMDFGFDLSENELDVVWDSLSDRIINEEAHFEDFFSLFLGSLSEEQTELIRKVMLKLDPTRSGHVEPDNFHKFYKSRRSVGVDSVMRQCALPDVKECFFERNGKVTRNVTWGAFLDYYFVVSLSVNSVDIFSQLLSDTWAV